MKDRQDIIPAGMEAIYRDIGYAPAVRGGDTLYISGQIGRDAQMRLVEGREAQFVQVFENLKTVLHAAGADFDDIVDVTSFHTDPERQFEAFMAIKNEVFPRPPHPNWTAVGVNWLAGFDFEIKVIARVPDAPAGTAAAS